MLKWAKQGGFYTGNKILNDKVIKKALAKENKDIRNYIARIISDITGLTLEEIENLKRM